jgi:hypothetical protein
MVSVTDPYDSILSFLERILDHWAKLINLCLEWLSALDNFNRCTVYSDSLKVGKFFYLFGDH